MVLWSEAWGVRDGSLDEIFAKSRNIRRSSLKILLSIANALLERLKPLVVKDKLERLDELEPRLTAMTAEASYLIHDVTDIDSDSSSDGSSDFELDTIDEIVEDLRTDVQCLTELNPLIRNPVFDRSSQKQKELEVADWAPQKAFCDKIEQRFPQADNSLVLGLGEANWWRFQTCQELRLKNELAEQQQLGTAKGDHETVADSKFHDSGLGTSLPTRSSYAETIMTYSGSNGQKTRIPPLTDEAKRGKPFPCVACGKVVRVTNNSAWKRHLYSDLQPYLCLETKCGMLAFRNRNEWSTHLALEHYEPDWEPETCPLCFETTGQGQIAITRHLAGHLEEISLSALPTNADEEAEEASSEASLGSLQHHDPDADAGPGIHSTMKTRLKVRCYQGLPKPDGSDGGCMRCETIGSTCVRSRTKPEIKAPTFKCICGNPEPDDNTIYCPSCTTWQHIDCYYNDYPEQALRESFEHLCNDCNPRPLDISGARSRQESKRPTKKHDSVDPEDGEVVRCVCGHDDYPGPAPGQLPPSKAAELIADAGGLFIQCDTCKVWQHGACMGILSDEQTPDEYFCEICRKDLHILQTTSNGLRYSQYQLVSQIVPPKVDTKSSAKSGEKSHSHKQVPSDTTASDERRGKQRDKQQQKPQGERPKNVGNIDPPRFGDGRAADLWKCCNCDDGWFSTDTLDMCPKCGNYRCDDCKYAMSDGDMDHNNATGERSDHSLSP
ncbi:hypothetical protein EDB80DRAFT_842405 [Ilyonectria destructans]|nr:hypothetical protein EDB80DRAFT_842405 [Ilyonectria destructans]